MENFSDLNDSKKYIEFLDKIKKIDLDTLDSIDTDDILLIIKILIRYEYEEAALLIYKKAFKSIGKLSNSIKNKITSIDNLFKSIDYQHSCEIKRFKTTTEIYTEKIYLNKNIIKKKLRFNNILLVISSLGPGGAERQFTNLFNHLSKDNILEIKNVYGLVLSLDKENSQHYINLIDSSYRKNIITYNEDEVESEFKPSYGGKTRRLCIAKIRKAIREKEVDSVIGFLEETALTVCLSALAENIIGITRFGSMPSTFDRNLTDDMIIKSNNRFDILSAVDSPNIVWGANSRKCLNKYLSVINFNTKKNNKKTLIIPNIVTMPEIGCYEDKSLTNKCNGKTVVISIMRLSNEKRPELFVNLAKYFLSKPSLLFVLIGDGPLRGQVESELAELPNFYWVSNTSDISYYLSKSHIYVMTSIVEGSPNAVIESSYFGLPAVTANVGGVSETYTDGLNAIFVKNPREFESYVLALESLINDTELRSNIGRSAQDRIINRHGGTSTSAAIGLALEKFI